MRGYVGVWGRADIAQKRNLPMRLFQITEEDIQRASLSEKDVGKWCFVVSGIYFGFFETRELGEEYLRKVQSHA